METEKGSVMFRDLAEFLDNERVTANTVFGKIIQGRKSKKAMRNSHLQNRYSGIKARLAAQVGIGRNLPSSASCSWLTHSTGDASCSFCKAGLALETCEALRHFLYEDLI